MACPHCHGPPDCPVCGREMSNCDRVMPPRMSGSSHIIGHKWICSQSDGAGTQHIVELSFPHVEQ